MKPRLLLCAMLAAFTLPAEVYLLAPGRRNTAPSPVEVPGIGPQALLTEEVVVNGCPLSLQLYAVQQTLEKVADWLKHHCSGFRLSMGSGWLRADFPAPGGGERRWFFTSAGAGKPLTAFFLEVPPVKTAPQWPKELPALPPGAELDMVMFLPKRNAVYGSFKGAAEQPEEQLVILAAALKSQGWQAVGNESTPAIRGRGDIFFRTGEKREMLWVNFSENGFGAYCRTILP